MRSGCEIYYPHLRRNNPKRVFLAESIANSINKELPGKAIAKEDSETAQGSLGVLGGDGSEETVRHNIPAILFEAGYLTNEYEYTLLQNHVYISQLIALICDGIDDYFIKYPPRVNP